MPRSARRKSTPLSPAKSRVAPTPPRQTRRSTRTQSRELEDLPARNTRRKRQLEPVEEQEETVVVRDPSDAAQPDLVVGSNAADDIERDSEPAESLVSSSNESPVEFDHEEIIGNLVYISQDAEELLGQVRRLSIDQLAEGLADPDSTISKRLLRAAQRLRDSSEPCGKAQLFPLHALKQALADHDVPAAGACLIFMKTNLARFVLALFNVKLEDRDLSISDCLEHLTVVQSFPEPFVMLSMDQRVESTVFGREFELKTLGLGVAILTQLYIKIVAERIEEDDFDPDLLLRQVFTDEEGNLRNVSLNHISAEDNSDLKKGIETRMRDIRKYTSTNAAKPVDLEALQKRYSRKDFLERAVAWTMERANQLAVAIDNEGGASTIRDLLEAGPQAITPKQLKQKQSSKRSREEKALEEGTSFLRELEDELDAADEEDESEEESEIEDQEEEQQEQVGVEIEAPPTSERKHPETIPESPQAEGDQQKVLQEQLDDADAQIQAEADAAHANSDDQQVEQDVPDSTQPPPDWMTRPTQETLNVLNVTQRQEKESNKENSLPRKRYTLLDRQPDAQKFNWDDDESQSGRQQRNAGKRRRTDDESDEEDDFETDPRRAKRPRPQDSKAPAVLLHSREDHGESSIFVNVSVEPEERAHAQSRASSQPVLRRPATADNRAAPSSTAPPARRAPSATSPQQASAPPPSTYENYVATQQLARKNVKFASLVSATTRQRPPQVRRAWEAEEIVRFMDLMQRCGTSWAKIKQADERMARPLLMNRSQVQLKDKARNMKLDCLKAEQELPEYLEGVTISRTHKEQLRAMGIAVPGDEEEE